MLLSSTLPVQFSEGKYRNKVTMDFVEICENSNCANNGPLTQGDGTSTALIPLQISTGEQVQLDHQGLKDQ